MRRVFVGISLILFLGCGGGDGSSQMQVPIKIGVEMPEVIILGDDEYREHVGGQEKTSEERLEDENNYKQIKPITWAIEKRFDETKFNISIVNSVMAEIEEHCTDTPLGEVCKIPKDTIEFLFNKQMVDKLMGFVSRDKISAVDSERIIGERVYFGSLEFVRHDENSTYGYSLMMDSTDIEHMFFDIKESKQYIKTIKWSKDNRKIFYSSLVGNERATLYYQNIPNLGEDAHLSFFTFSEVPFIGKTHIFDLSRESNNTDFILKIKRVDMDEISGLNRSYRKHSYLKILEERGYCSTIFLSIYPEVFFDEDGIIEELYFNSTSEMYHQVFDKNGTIEASRYCTEFDSENDDITSKKQCNFEDITTWSSINSDDALLFEPFDELYFREIWIGQGYIADGEYFLLSGEHNIASLTMEDVLKYSVASFVKLVGIEDTYGFVYDKSYSDMYDDSVHQKINSLQMVRAKYNDDLNLSLDKRVAEFEVVKDEDRPEIW